MQMRIALMFRVLAVVAVSVVSLAATAFAQEKAIHTQKTTDAVITLKSETGQWKQGPNKFALELTTPSGQPLDAGKATLSTSMTMPGMGPMITGATLTPDKSPGRYLGTISFPDSGARQVTVSWDGPGGKGSARFPVPVR
jgi:YtkA-like protein